MMQQWEYLQVDFPVNDYWWDSIGRQGPCNTVFHELKYKDRDGEEKKAVYTSRDYAYMLNQLGADGWELVTMAFDSNNRLERIFFKRPKQ